MIRCTLSLRALWFGLGRIARVLSLAVVLGLCGAPASAQDSVPINLARATPEQLDALFLEGLELVRIGRPRDAVIVFQRILAQHPDLLRVRLELARAHFFSGNWADARKEFLVTLSGDLPDPVRRTVLAYIREIDARRGFEWDFSLGLGEVGDLRVYDTDRLDLDLGFGALPFTLNRDEGSAPGLIFSGSATMRGAVAPLGSADRNVTAFAQVFTFGEEASGSRHDDVTLGARAGLRMIGGTWTASISPVVSSRYLQGSRAEEEVGIEAGFEARNAAGVSLFGSGAALNKTAFSRLGDDARLQRLRLGVSKSISGSALIGADVFAEHADFVNGFESYEETRLSAFGLLDAPFGLRLQGRVFLGEKSYPTPSALFVGNPDETSIGASLRVEKLDWFVLESAYPFIELSGKRVKSGIDAFSYTENRIIFGFRRSF
jgi:hypothetical protein